MRNGYRQEGRRERSTYIGEKEGQGREGEKKEKNKERESKTDGGKERGEEGREIEEGRDLWMTEWHSWQRRR